VRKRSEEASEERLHCLNDEMKVAFKLESMRGKERLKKLAKMCIDVSGSVWSESRGISGAKDGDNT
jgi:hypothetical protein